MRKEITLWLAGGVLLAATVASIAAQEKPFTVGTATAQPGHRATGAIEVPAGNDAALNIPVVVIRGAKPGPVLAIVSGLHGTEYASIIAVESLVNRIDPATVSGTVILLPLVNVNSFEQKIPHLNPVDGKNMNRMFPGNRSGTQTERADYLITREVVERCDHLIDIHGGDLDESLRPYGYWTKTGNERQDAVSRDMVLAFGLDHIIISTDRPKDPAASRYLENTATTRGKPSITVEAGHAGTVEPEDVEALARGCLSVMRFLKMLPGQPERIDHPVWIDRVETIAGDRNGIFYPLVRRGTYVAEGMPVGYLTDYVGNRILDVRSSVAGVVLFIRAMPSMTKGETIANIGVVAALK